MNQVNYDKMSLHELREVARVQAHELGKLKTTQFKDEFARRLGLRVVEQLRNVPTQQWAAEHAQIYTEVAVLQPVGARCWRMGAV